MEDYEIDDEVSCPLCDHSPLHYRDCTNWCDDGYFDESDDDAINYTPGESFRECEECHGTGVEWWCPKCGANLSGNKDLQKQFDEIQEHWDNN